MGKKALIGILGALGWVVSYGFFVKWLGEHEWAFIAGWQEAFTASDFATGLIYDLVAVTGMMIVLALTERRRLGTKWTVAVIASLGLSVSVSLTVYLFALWRSSPEGEPASDTPASG